MRDTKRCGPGQLLVLSSDLNQWELYILLTAAGCSTDFETIEPPKLLPKNGLSFVHSLRPYFLMLTINPYSVLRFVTLSLGILSSSLDAALMNYNGAFDSTNPNEVFTTSLTLNTTSNVTIQTFSYGGGITHDGTVVPSGSFDPTITLFLGFGPGAVLLDTSYFNDDGTCPPANPDPATLLCLDSVLSLYSLASGTYTIVLTVAGNAPLAVSIGSGTIGDGFEGNGFFDQPPISRYVFDVVTTAVPEPNTMILFGLAGVALRFRTSRVAKNDTEDL